MSEAVTQEEAIEILKSLPPTQVMVVTVGLVEIDGVPHTDIILSQKCDCGESECSGMTPFKLRLSREQGERALQGLKRVHTESGASLRKKGIHLPKGSGYQ